MLTPKENVLEVINWGNPEYVPMTFEAFKIVGVPATVVVEAPFFKSDFDPFGIYWHVTPEGAVPDSSKFLLDDICNWRDVVKFPDMDEIASKIHALAKDEIKDIDRTQQLITIYVPCGLFERLAAFMGFEEALISMATEPEECREFFEAFADYKIRYIDIMIDAYQPDVYVFFDDIATAHGMFMSPDTWRDVVKPAHTKIAKAITDRGVIYEQHTCGKCEDILEDYVEMGAKLWHSAQPMNDIVGIQDRFKGCLVIEGGWDSSGPPSYLGATEEELRTEVRRNLEEYGNRGGFILMPTIMNEKGNSLLVGDDRMPSLFDEWRKYCMFD